MKDWSVPVDLEDFEIVFAANCEKFLPSMKEIPEEFHNRRHPYVNFAGRIFFSGSDGLKFKPKEGIDPKKALRQLRAALSTFEPKHEHKMAGVGYLLSLFFDIEVEKEEEVK